MSGKKRRSRRLNGAEDEGGHEMVVEPQWSDGRETDTDDDSDISDVDDAPHPPTSREELQGVDMSADGRLRLRPSIELGDEDGYGGRVTSKAAVFGEEDSEDDELGDQGGVSSDGEEREVTFDDGEGLEVSSDEVEVGEPSSSGGDDDDDDDDDDDEIAREFERLRQEDAQILSKSQLQSEDDRERGLAIIAQRKLWEKVLNIRIRVQKLLSGANRMPQPEEHRAIKRDFPSLASEYAEVEQAAREALGCLVGLQRALVEAAEGESAAPEEGEVEVADAEEGWGALNGCHDSYIGRVVEELDRWHRKATLGSAAGARRGQLKALTQTISSQVRVLTDDPQRVARRTHIASNTDGHRVLCSFAGGRGEEKVEEQEYDCETYDDGEFYSQVLKEFLDSQSLSAGQIAKAKGAKRRKVVDRKASKGRKIRYHVHEKLVNFMVPAEFDRPEFAEKLFGSLFAYRSEG